VQAATVDYYAARHDQDPSVAAFIRARAAGLREVGLTDEDIGRVEFLQFGAATGNSIATLMWFTIHVFSDPAIVERLRGELLPLLDAPSGQGPREVTLNIATLEERCPFMMACFKEVLRVVNVQTSVRRVLEDTFVMDGHGGQYLLKKGEDVVMPHAIAHRYDSNAWGPEEDALVFRPENFMPSPSDRAKGLDKARRAAWVPFGGGPGLCPGRRIVLVEELAFMSTLVLGFEVAALDGAEIKLPEAMPMGLGHAIVRPAENAQLGVRLKRRAGWEDVVWNYELGKGITEDL
jgi:cytochrome P450